MAKKKSIWDAMPKDSIQKEAAKAMKTVAPKKEVVPEEEFVRIKAYKSTRTQLKKIAVEQDLSMQEVLSQIIEKEFNLVFGR